jgi:hypothetical protein
LVLLVALASVTSLGFGSALVFAGSKAGTGRIGVRVVSGHGAVGRTGATMVGKRGVAKAAAIPGGSITTVCAAAGTVSGSTFTLHANCGDVTSPITVPSSITTVNGDGFTISATDIGFSQFNGGILTNESSGQAMNIENLTVSGPVGGFQIAHNCDYLLYGIYFNDAGGSVKDSTVENIWQQPNASGAPSCNRGTAIRADNPSAPRTLTITNTTVLEYQKNGIDGRGDGLTMDVSKSSIGPPNNQEGLIAANGLLYFGGATGTAENNTIQGSGDEQLPGPPGGGTNAIAVYLYGAQNVTITHNTITGAKTDIGVGVEADSTGKNIISFNTITRTGPDVPDPTGHGISVYTPDHSIATPICNTFSNWNTNIVGAEQISCTPLPDGTECDAYSAPAPAVDSGKNYGQTGAVQPPGNLDDRNHIIDATPFTWTVESGTLPPGLSLSSAGAITGTPTAAGTFNFTMKVVDSTGLTATQAQTITIHPGSCGTTSAETSTSTVTTTTTESLPATTVTVPAETITHPETVTLPAATVTTPGHTTVVTVPAGQTTTTVTQPAQTVTAPTETKTVVVTVTDPSHPVLLPPRIIVINRVKTLVRTITRTLIRACKPAMGAGKG